MSYVSRALDVPDLKPRDRLVLLKLAAYGDEYEKVCPSVDTIAEEIGMGIRTVHRALDALEASGLISRRRAKGYRSSQYLLFPDPADMAEKSATLTESSAALADNLLTTSSSSQESSCTSYKGDAPSGRSPQDGVITRGWPQRKRKDNSVGYPGFEDEEKNVPRRGETDDTSHLVGIGNLNVEKPRRPQPKPVQRWTATDFYGYLNGLATKAAPDLTNQVQAGWCKGDFNKWLKAGIDREALKLSIDWFFQDEGNLLGLGRGLTIWQRYRVFWIQNQGRVTEFIRNQQPHQVVKSSGDRALEEYMAKKAQRV